MPSPSPAACSQVLLVLDPDLLALGHEAALPVLRGAQQPAPAEREACDDVGQEHRERDHVDEVADGGRQRDLCEVAARAEDAADQQDVERGQTRERRDDVGAVVQFAAASRVRGGRHAAGEGDVGTEDRAERHLSESRIRAREGERHAHQHADPREGEGGQRTDRGAERGAAERSDQCDPAEHAVPDLRGA